jgi:Cytochrome c7 and related cytochrome c
MSMNHKVFGVCCIVLGSAGVLSKSEVRLPGGNQGYEPEQPIAFSHRLHAGELSMSCEYCHYGARQSRNAGVPSSTVCMNCHKAVTSSADALFAERAQALSEGREAKRVFSPEIQKLYTALALDELGNEIPGVEPRSIDWVRVHNLPDFVYFDHRPHVARNIACETCHGPVGTMDRMRQESSLSMGWCIDCHRANALGQSSKNDASDGRVADHISTNCVTCHL